MVSEKEIRTEEKSTVDKASAQKILRSLPFEQGFHFATSEGNYNKETAINLFSFYEELRNVELASVRFHFNRRDFQKWLETGIGDPELASRMDKMPSGLNDQDLRKELVKIIRSRLTELQTVANMQQSTMQQAAPELNASAPRGEEIKKFKLEEIRQFSGQAGNAAYVVFEGKIYDVTDSSLWQGGDHMSAHKAGEDLTEAMATAPHGKEVLDKMKQVGVIA